MSRAAPMFLLRLEHHVTALDAGFFWQICDGVNFSYLRIESSICYYPKLLCNDHNDSISMAEPPSDSEGGSASKSSAPTQQKICADQFVGTCNVEIDFQTILVRFWSSFIIHG